MEDGVAATVTLVTVTVGGVVGLEMVTAAVPVFVESCVEVALTVSNPEAGTLEGEV
jgi:hypothetical protein